MQKTRLLKWPFAAIGLAEGLVFGEASSGAGGDQSSDLAQIARSAANQLGAYGLGELGAMWLAPENSHALLREIFGGNLPEVATLISAAEADANRHLAPQKDRLVKMAQALMATGVLAGDQLAELLASPEETETA